MKISEKGINFIIKEEGEYLKSYKCQAGVWTIGVGHTGNIKEGMTITKEKSRILLKNDLERFEKCVNGNIKVDLKQCEYDALVSFAFNVGEGAFAKSTLVKKINSKSNLSEIEIEFNKWVRGGGKILPVLVGRRKREFKMYKGE